MISRCRPITHHTRDSVVSNAAAKVLKQAYFPSGHRCVCDCMEPDSKIESRDCKNLNVYDADGKRIANFSMADFQAAQSDDGGILILRRTAGTRDAGRLTLRKLNEWHLDFYKRGDL